VEGGQTRLAQHRLAKAVVLADQIHALDGAVLFEHTHQGRHAHVGVRIEAEMPEAALFVGEDRIHRRVIQEHDAPLRLALVVLVDRLDQRRGHRRRIALHHDACAVVDGSAQGRQGLLGLTLAVIALERHRAHDAADAHTATLVHALQGPGQVADHGLAGVGKGPGQALDHGDTNRRARQGRGRGRGRSRDRRRLGTGCKRCHAQQQRGGELAQGTAAALLNAHVSSLKKYMPDPQTRSGLAPSRRQRVQWPARAHIKGVVGMGLLHP
jgi:hypothetical protein